MTLRSKRNLLFFVTFGLMLAINAAAWYAVAGSDWIVIPLLGICFTCVAAVCVWPFLQQANDRLPPALSKDSAQNPTKHPTRRRNT